MASRHSLLIPKRLLSRITQPPSVPSIILGRRRSLVRSVTTSAPSRPPSVSLPFAAASTAPPAAHTRRLAPAPTSASGRRPSSPAGCDLEHFLIVIDKPGGEGATKQQMIDCYLQTAAKILGSEEEAKKKIYSVLCKGYFGFGINIDEETSNKFKGLPGVLFVLPDSYVDAENQDYGGELFVDGEIVQRSPERQRRVEPYRDRLRYRYCGSTRYVLEGKMCGKRYGGLVM